NCSECHGEPHGPELTNCYDCHPSGHNPLPVSVPEADCSSCHEDPKATLEANPSSHTEMDCTSCHSQAEVEEHGYIPNCSSCHGEPHGANATDCYDCHTGGHEPTVLNYSVDIASSKCGSCHNTTYDNLLEGDNSHTELGCGGCHEEHGEIPTCESCHDGYHGIVNATNKRCLSCHQDAHVLKYPSTSS
ncbi:hypothetical protein C9439_00915, partial [archaeon SCG-AAA382B04]